MAAQRSLFFFFFTRNWPWKSGNFWKIEKNRRSAIWPILLAALSTQGGFSKLLSAQGPPGPLPLETLIRIPPLHESRNSSKISRSQTVTSFSHFQGLTMVTFFSNLMKLCLYTKKYRANPNRCPDFQDLTPPGSPDVLDWCPLTPHYYLTQSTENGAFRARAGLVGLLHRLEFFLRRCGHPMRMKDVLSSSKS